MGVSDGSDELLVQRVQGGEKAAFDLLVLKYQHRIHKLLTRYLHNETEALDVTQDAFLKAYRSLANFRGDSAFYTWLYRIAINTAKNHLSALARRPLERDRGEDEDGEDYQRDALLRNDTTPEDELLGHEVQKAILRAVEGLPQDLRTAILLREVEGMRYEEIAQAMECPIGTVRSRIFRAREAIDKILRPYVD
jgi:RNA polymerase sigma-70 factor (ECF subfamily)